MECNNRTSPVRQCPTKLRVGVRCSSPARSYPCLCKSIYLCNGVGNAPPSFGSVYFSGWIFYFPIPFSLAVICQPSYRQPRRQSLREPTRTRLTVQQLLSSRSPCLIPPMVATECREKLFPNSCCLLLHSFRPSAMDPRITKPS
jgi:hypothetical protein